VRYILTFDFATNDEENNENIMNTENAHQYGLVQKYPQYPCEENGLPRHYERIQCVDYGYDIGL